MSFAVTEDYQPSLPLDEERKDASGPGPLSKEEMDQIRWGGLLRRTIALFVDFLVLTFFSTILFYLVYVGYTVGLAAHHRTLSLERLENLLAIAVLSWLSLLIAYFVLLHGMDGRTVGKWLLDLRVVGARQRPITYSQSLVRCAGAFISALSGLGWLWILWQREKRGWHDLLADTWVARESSLKSLKD